jgi:formylglycine-generating enzyme required for sulfatase activity
MILGEPGVKKKVHRGGSFLFTDQYCARYIAGERGKGEPETGTNHVGFRTVRTPDVRNAQAARN